MPITALPSLDRTSATFKTDLDSYFLSALPAFSSEANALQTDVNDKQVTASAAAVTAAAAALTASAAATAAAATANAVRWVSGTTYALDVCAISPANSQTYRRKVAGAGTTDPSADPANWAKAVDALPVQTGNAGKFLTTNGTAESWGAVPASALTLLATLTPTAAVNVDALNIFSSVYDDYLILIDGLKPSSDSGLQIKFANAGVIDSGSNFFYADVSGQGGPYGYMFFTGGDVFNSGLGTCGMARVQNANGSGLKSIARSSVSQTAASTYRASGGGNGFAYIGGVISGIRFYWSTGANFAAQGTIRIYGYAK